MFSARRCDVSKDYEVPSKPVCLCARFSCILEVVQIGFGTVLAGILSFSLHHISHDFAKVINISSLTSRNEKHFLKTIDRSLSFRHFHRCSFPYPRKLNADSYFRRIYYYLLQISKSFSGIAHYCSTASISTI